MRRIIFWDTMLFIHLLDGDGAATQQVQRVFAESIHRGDELVTSCLVVGEVLAGTRETEKRTLLEEAMRSLAFARLPFHEECIGIFGELRSRNVAVADSIHLACAAAKGTDLFLTEDKALHRLHVPGIKFIAGMQSAFPQ